VEHELKRYKVLLYQRGTPDEFNWSETELSGFLDLTGSFCTSRREREFTRRTAGHGNQEV
jgi:hypothetical protein